VLSILAALGKLGRTDPVRHCSTAAEQQQQAIRTWCWKMLGRTLGQPRQSGTAVLHCCRPNKTERRVFGPAGGSRPVPGCHLVPVRVGRWNVLVSLACFSQTAGSYAVSLSAWFLTHLLGNSKLFVVWSLTLGDISFSWHSSVLFRVDNRCCCGGWMLWVQHNTQRMTLTHQRGYW
jgi:hypothetical protein